MSVDFGMFAFLVFIIFETTELITTGCQKKRGSLNPQPTVHVWLDIKTSICLMFLLSYTHQLNHVHVFLLTPKKQLTSVVSWKWNLKLNSLDWLLHTLHLLTDLVIQTKFDSTFRHKKVQNKNNILHKTKTRHLNRNVRPVSITI